MGAFDKAPTKRSSKLDIEVHENMRNNLQYRPFGSVSDVNTSCEPQIQKRSLLHHFPARAARHDARTLVAF
jgi:hypothetical protein